MNLSTSMAAPTALRLAGTEPGLRDYLGILHRARGLLLALTALGLLLGLAYALFAPPRYAANSLIALDSSRPQALAPRPEEFGPLAEASPAAAAEIEVLRSRELLGQVVDALRLDVDLAPSQSWLRRLTARALGTAPVEPGLRLRSFEPPRSLYLETFTLSVEAPGQFELRDPDGEPLLAGTTETLVRGTTSAGEPVTIELESLEAPAGAAFTLTKHSRLSTIKALQELLIVREKSTDSGVIEILYEDASPTRGAKLVNLLTAAYLKAVQTRNAAQNAEAFGFVKAELDKLQARVQGAESALSQFRQAHGSVNLPLETEALLRRRAELEGRLTTLAQEEAALARRYTEDHPALATARVQAAELRKELAGIDPLIQTLPQTEQAQLALTREVQSATSLYTSLLSTAETLRVMQQSPLTQTRIVDAAVPAEQPISPNRPLALLLGLMAGALLGLLAAFVREHLRDGLSAPLLIERLTGSEVCAFIPAGSAGRGLSLRESGRRGFLELYARLRPSLAATNPPTLAICPFSEDSGADFVAAHLATTLAETGQRCLLVDAAGSLAAHFRSAPGPGFTEWLSGRTLAECLHPGGVDGLLFMPAGSKAGTLPDARLDIRLRELAASQGAVLVLTTPALAPLIAGCTDDALLVIRAGQHSAPELQQAVQRLARAEAHVLGFVLNAAPAVHARA